MTVKLASLKADLDREAAGDWIDFPDWPGVAFNVSSLLKPAYVTARDLLLQKMSRQHKGKPVPLAESTPSVAALYCKHILHGWRGLDVDYSPETALTTLSDPAFRTVMNAVEWCSRHLSIVEAEFVEEEEKNSAAPSAGV
jgi:hypothetical protein